ncbi:MULTISPECIES: hypothetical protein [Paenibacillus]|uniref:DUF4007 domain-containing protein n=1 Tax=Paenibacillus odorifer TaxID=189426 RepID=A0ABX3HX96_9BACL|nr:hypothetical protein [Paenibacillus odorifer]OMD55315.1 hypothetical protein BSK51_04485 [Paenibacillus odorifer]
MSKMIPDLIISKKETKILINKLDLNSPVEITEEDYIKVFGDRTLKSLLLQAMEESNHFDMGKRKIKTNTGIKQIVGCVLENFIVGLMGIDLTTKKNLFEWCTGITYHTFKEGMYGYDNFISLLFAVKVVGRASKLTKIHQPDLFSTSDAHDIEFYIPDLNRHNKLTPLGGLQVKALQGNEKVRIVEPLLKKKYKCVLTLLKDEKHVHSYERCSDILYDLYKKGEIDTSDYLEFTRRIKKPNQVGIPQRLINDIYTLLLKLENDGLKILDKDGNVLSNKEFLVSGLITAMYTLDQGESLIITESEENNNFTIN